MTEYGNIRQTAPHSVLFWDAPIVPVLMKSPARFPPMVVMRYPDRDEDSFTLAAKEGRVKGFGQYVSSFKVQKSPEGMAVE